jgi:hypothetical protein
MKCEPVHDPRWLAVPTCFIFVLARSTSRAEGNKQSFRQETESGRHAGIGFRDQGPLSALQRPLQQGLEAGGLFAREMLSDRPCLIIIEKTGSKHAVNEGPVGNSKTMFRVHANIDELGQKKGLVIAHKPQK